jgi:transposase
LPNDSPIKRPPIQIDLREPVRGDYRRQAQAGQSFAVADFAIDWQAQHATCPVGRTSISWTPAFDNRANAMIKIKFSMRGQRCDHLETCTDGKRRSITICQQEQHEALRARRQRVTTPEFKHDYAKLVLQ